MSPNLEMQLNKMQVGLYTVTYARKEAPLDVQEAAFAANSLEIVSPAQLGFLRAHEGNGSFNSYSRTNADVFYDDRSNHNQVVVVLDGVISKLVGVANLVSAHRQNSEYVIPEDQRDLVYGMVDEMLRKGTAFTANYGQTDVRTSEFGKTELISRLFSDKRLGIKAQDYGDFLKGHGTKIQTILFNDRAYAESQKGPYLNRLRVYSPDYDFNVIGNLRDLDVNLDGAFGVRFEKAASDMRGELSEPRSPVPGAKK